MDDDKLNEGESSGTDGQPPEGAEGLESQNTAGSSAGADIAGKAAKAASVVAKRSVKAIILNIFAVSGFVLVFASGLVVMFYPNISNYVNQKNQSRAVQSYVEAVKQFDPIDYEKYLEEAREYNAKLAGRGTKVRDAFAVAGSDDDRTDEYWSLLKIGNSNVMGYVRVDSLGIEVPLYHGTGDIVLSVGAGHIQGSSLPVGGESTHTAVSAHTGLPSARFFDKIDTLVEGDTFSFRVMNEVLTYQVDQILVVLPEEVEALAIEQGEDYATLVTCTPYGINSHRLLVRGTRIETPPEQLPKSVETAAEAVQEEPGFLQEAEDFIVEKLAVVVEFVATGIVNLAQGVMDIFDIEY